MFKKLMAFAVAAISIVSCSKNQQVLQPRLGDETLSKAGVVEGAPKPVETCSNVIQFDLKQGKREAIPTIWSIQMTYTIKPCNTAQTVSGAIDVFDINTGEQVYAATDLPLSGKTTFLGVAFGLYKAVLKVVDVKTGAVIETKVATIKVAWPGV